jgi:hypothetical protein
MTLQIKGQFFDYFAGGVEEDEDEPVSAAFEDSEVPVEGAPDEEEEPSLAADG